MTLFLIAVVLVALAMLAMAVGVLATGRCLRGSCGGPEVLGPDGESLLCDHCPRREELAARRREAAAELIEISTRT